MPRSCSRRWGNCNFREGKRTDVEPAWLFLGENFSVQAPAALQPLPRGEHNPAVTLRKSGSDIRFEGVLRIRSTQGIDEADTTKQQACNSGKR